ncbi:MAG: hypothetical protein NTV00_09125 [Methylococcales bacterium]|nr:hypothetical protein [Methylococcales bacterium]
MSNSPEDIKHDKFLLIVGAIALLLITAVLMEKRNDNITTQQNAAAPMNMRMLNNTH